jgi:hypothetical protein
MSNENDRMMQLVDRSARVGMSPHEWLRVLESGQPDPVSQTPDMLANSDLGPLSREQWRDAMLSTIGVAGHV